MWKNPFITNYCISFEINDKDSIYIQKKITRKLIMLPSANNCVNYMLGTKCGQMCKLHMDNQ